MIFFVVHETKDENLMTNMEKRSYVAPESVVVELETANLIAASFDIAAGSKDGVNNMGSNNRRGEWGNLWVDN